MGDVQPCETSQELVARYLRYQPDAKQYLDLDDFVFFQLTPKRARYVAGLGEMGWVEEVDWANGAGLPLADEAKFHRELTEDLPLGIRLLGLGYYEVDIERQGRRERQQFPNAPVATENVGEMIKRFLAAL